MKFTSTPLLFRLALNAVALCFVGGAAQAAPYTWNTTTGTWDAVTANWSGTGTTWVDGNDAIFNNTATLSTITLSGTISTSSLLFGSATATNNNANYTLTGGVLNNAGSLIVQGLSSNGATYASNPTVTINSTATITGDTLIGRANLTISGGTFITNRITANPTSTDWANFTISGGTVTATNGIDGTYGTTGSNGTTATFAVNLNGGTLFTPSIKVADRETGGNAWLTFNGTTVKATQSNANFITLYGGAQNSYISNGGALLDTNTFNVGIGVNLKNTSGQTGGVTKLGAGTLTLSGTNSYVGNTTVGANSGTLNITNAANTTTGTFILNAGGTLNLASFSDYGVASAMGSRLATSETGDPTDSPTTGIGLHFLGGTLQYTGSTAQSTNRQIRLGANGTNAIDASGTGSGTLSFTYSGTNTNLFDTGGARTLNLTGSNTGNNLFAIKLENQATSPTTLIKSGAGKWLVTNTNTFTGIVGISAGTLNVASLSDYGVASSIGARAAGSETAAGDGIGIRIGTGTVGGTLQYTGSTPQSTNRQIRISAANNTIDASGTGAGTLSFTYSGANTNLFDTAGARTLTLTGSNTGDNTFAIKLENQGGNATSLTKTGAGKWIASGVHTYTGATTVSEGTLTLSGNRTVTATGGFTVANVSGTAATLNISNGTFNLGTTTVVGSGTGNTTAGTINQSGGTLTTAGNQLLLGNGGTGTTAGSNSSGTYNLSGGTLNTLAGTLGVVLGVNTGTTGNFNLSGTGILAMPATSTLQIGRSDGSLSNNATGVFTQTGGTATVGILRMGGASAANDGSNATLTLTGGTFSAVTFGALSGGTNSSSVINVGGTADVTLPAFPAVLGAGSTATINFDGGTLRPAAASATYLGGITSAFIKAGGAKFDVDAAKDITITQSLLTDVISTGGGLTKSGAGSLTLTGTNTYTGGVTLNAGTLQIGSPSALGSSSGTITINGGNIRAANAPRSLSNPVTVNGSFILGRLTDLNGPITLTTDATITATNPDGVANGNSLLGPVSGGFRLTLAEGSGGGVAPFGLGTGALVINAANTNTGGTTVASGRVTVSPSGSLANADLVVNSGELNFNNTAQSVTGLSGTGGTINLGTGHTLTVNQAGNSTYAGVIASAGNLKKTGVGTLTLSGISTYSGSTVLAEGALQLGADGALPDATSFQFSANGTLLSVNGKTDVTGPLSLSMGATDLATIDLDGGASVFSFANSAGSAWTGLLQIINWSGSVTGGGTDQLYFGSSALGLSGPQLASITFVNPDGFSSGTYGAQLLSTGELIPVPVPEPSVLAAFGVFAAVAGFQRRRPTAERK